ncbi:HAD family phosphatase [Pirellulales bacterium]|nr:HAD family phosphatase [Pirellulales bacterium]
MVSQLAVIFDVDGVLVDSYQPHYQSWRRLFDELDVDYSEDVFRNTFGRTNRDIFTTLFPGELSEERLTELGDRKEEYYREIIRDDFPAMPGATELIDRLSSARFLMAVGSSGPPENIALTLEKLEREHAMSAAITSADVTRGKPDPQVFLLAAQRLNVPPAQCAVVEDAHHGIEAANRAGMISIGLTSTTTREKLAAADLVVDRLDELTPDRIKELMG